jgi:hypothetical protein
VFVEWDPDLLDVVEVAAEAEADVCPLKGLGLKTIVYLV